MSGRKFQFKSRLRLIAPENAVRNVSTETLYSSDFGDTASELSMSIIGAEDEMSSSTCSVEYARARSTPIVEAQQYNEDDIDNMDVEAKMIPAQTGTIVIDDQQPSTSTNLMANMSQQTRIVIEAADTSRSSTSASQFSDADVFSVNRLSPRDDDIQSQLSFIVKERLHEFAKNIRRRTSQVREEIVREPTPDSSDTEAATASGGHGERQQATLMSLIGLREETEEEENTDERTSFFNLTTPIDPFGRRYTFWLFFVVAALLYNAFTIPLRSSYPYQTDENLLYWIIVDYICDIVYVLDIIMVKPRLIFMRGGIAIRDSYEMRRNYLSSKKFKLDVLSLLPLDFFYFITGPICAWRVVRVLKFCCFWDFFGLLDSSVSNPYVIRIAKTFSYMIYIIHCNSCIYYMLSAWQAFGQIPYVYRGKYHLNKWVYNNEGNAYIRCFYFTAAVATSTGNNPSPTNVVEYIYMTFSWMMGVFVFALLLGQIRDIVYNANKNSEEFRGTMDKALGECKRLGLPDHLTARVRSWFLYTWEQQKTLDEKKLVVKLPLKLQTDLALSVHYGTLSKVQLFQDADRAFLRDLVLKLRPVIFLPGDMICQKGDVGKEMYIVNNGILEVVGGDNNELIFATLKEGSVFGEISLLAIGGNNRRTANIRSKGFSTLFVLSKEDLNDVLKDYPDAQHLMRRKARQLLQKDVHKRTDTTTEEAARQARADLAKKCHVSVDFRTPRMLEAVAQLIPPHSRTSKMLNEAMEKKPEKERSRQLKRWSTIPVDFSDISEVEDTAYSPTFAPTHSPLTKARSLEI